MSYQFAIEQENYEDLASGRVLYNQHGSTAFPVRLASDLFQRAKAALIGKGSRGPYRIYDPCCGGGYMLASIGFLHGEDLESITASDIDPSAVDLACRNLSLLTAEGLRKRVEQIEQLHASYGKQSHAEALAGAKRLRRRIDAFANPAGISDCFVADATQPNERLAGRQFDIVLTDVPYGNKVEWKTEASEPTALLLDRLEPLLTPESVVILVSAKESKITHDRYRRLGQFKMGKRRVALLESLANAPTD
ncbi:MAG: hypothetical protein K0R28_851 [Paenibacillus sp.]|nr:hypothetical protein [Paenibacillus sp.]